MQDRIGKNRRIIFMLFVYVFLGMVWLIVTPPFQNADEQAHYAYVQYLAENGEIPNPDELDKATVYNPYIQKVIAALGTDNMVLNSISSLNRDDIANIKDEISRINEPKVTAYHFPASGYPPLYYAINLPFYYLGDFAGGFVMQIFAMRFLSLIVSCVTLFYIYLLGKTFLKSEIMALACAALVGLSPAFLHLSTSINNDNLLIMFFTIGIYVITAYSAKMNWRIVLSIIAFGVLAGLTKPQGWFILPIAGFILGMNYFMSIFIRRKMKITLLNTILILIALLPFLGPYAIVNFSDIEWKWLSSDYLSNHYLIVFKQIIKGLVGQFNWGATVLALPYYYISICLFFVCGAVFIKNYVRHIEEQKRWYAPLAIVICFSSVIFLIDDYYLLKENEFTLGIQARYFFPVIGCSAVMLMYGLMNLFKNNKYKKFLPYVVIYLMLLFNFLTLINYYIPRFYA